MQSDWAPFLVFSHSANLFHFAGERDGAPKHRMRHSVDDNRQCALCSLGHVARWRSLCDQDLTEDALPFEVHTKGSIWRASPSWRRRSPSIHTPARSLALLPQSCWCSLRSGLRVPSVRVDLGGGDPITAWPIYIRFAKLIFGGRSTASAQLLLRSSPASCSSCRSY